MTRIDGPTKQYAQQKGLQLDKLDTKEQKVLDTNNDGTISKTEVDSAVQQADKSKDGYINAGELTSYKQVLGQKAKSAGALQLSSDAIDVAKKAGIESPGKAVELLTQLTGGDKKKAEKLLGKLGRIGGGADALKSIALATKEFGKGNHRVGTSHMLDGLAGAWSALPTEMRQKTMTQLSNMLKKIPKLGGFASMVGDLEKIGATPGLMKMTAGALRGDAKGVEGGFRDILNGLKKADAATAAKIGGKTVAALSRFLPKSVIAKITAKKIPGVSLVPAAWDTLCGLGNLVTGQWGDAGKRFASAGSGALSTIPGWGTAASVAIDLGLLTYDVASAAQSLSSTPISSNPFK